MDSLSLEETIRIVSQIIYIKYFGFYFTRIKIIFHLKADSYDSDDLFVKRKARIQ